MGLFSSKTKTHVDVASHVTRAIEDRLIISSARSGVIRNTFSGGGVVENILEDMIAGIGIRADQMYAYGKNGYVYGLPSSSLLFNNSGKDIIKGVIELIEGRTVTIDYYHYGPLNSLHYGWKTLCESYDYDQYTNEIKNLSVLKGFPVYLDNLQVVVVEATFEELNNGALDQWGCGATSGYTPLRPTVFSAAVRNSVKHTPYATDVLATQDYFILSYIWKDGGGVVHTESLQFPMSQEDPNKGYFQVKYSYGELTDNNGNDTPNVPVYSPDSIEYYIHLNDPPLPKLYDASTKYFTYVEGEGSFPELDEIFKHSNDGLGSFFPFLHFRNNKRSIISNQNSVEFKSSKKLAKYLGIEYRDVAEAIDANPDIQHIESALMMMGVPADTTNQLELKYLYAFFKSLYLKTGSAGLPKSVQTSAVIALMNGTPQYSLNNSISMGIQDGNLHLSLSMGGVYRRRRVGSIGPIGFHTMQYGSLTTTAPAIRYKEDGASEEYTVDTVYPYRSYLKQLSANVYDEYQVFGLNTIYTIEGNYAAAANVLLIPVDRSITNSFSVPDKEVLYSRSMHYIFNTLVITQTKVKWYQQSWFRIVLIIVAIIITIFADWSGSTLGIALAAGQYAAAALIVLVMIIEAVVIKLVFKQFVKMVGADIAMIVAVVLLVVGVYNSQAVSGVAGAPWASQMVMASNGLMTAVTNSYKDALNTLYEEGKSFNIFAEEKYKALEETNKLLENNVAMSPFVIFGEKPDEYFNRTIHSGNIGVASIDAISSYVDISLTLPTLQSSVGMGIV